MKDKKLLFLVGIIAFLSLGLPVFFWIRDYAIGKGTTIDSSVLSDLSDFLSFVIAFWGLVINIVLLRIAYKAFLNFDVKKQFHNKQLEIVSDLATSISRMNLRSMLYRTSIDPSGVEHLIPTGWEFSLNETALGIDYSKFELLLVRTNNIENTFPFLKFRAHPLLPVAIAKQINKFYRPLQYQLPVEKSNLPKTYIVLSPEQIAEDDYSRDWLYEYNDAPTDFSENFKALRKSITDWYETYGASDSNI